MRTDTSPADTGTLRVEATLGPDGAIRRLAGKPPHRAARLLAGCPARWPQPPAGRTRRRPARRTRPQPQPAWHPRPKQHRSRYPAHQRPSRRLRSPASALRRGRLPRHRRNTFHTFTNIECRWPPSSSSGPNLLVLTANLPDIRQPNSASAALTLPALPADTFLDWLGVATPTPLPALLAPEPSPVISSGTSRTNSSQIQR